MNTTKKALTLALLITAVAPCNATFFKSMWKIAAGVGGIGKSVVTSKKLPFFIFGLGMGPYLLQQPEERTPINNLSFNHKLNPCNLVKNLGINLWNIGREFYDLGETEVNRLIEKDDK